MFLPIWNVGWSNTVALDINRKYGIVPRIWIGSLVKRKYRHIKILLLVMAGLLILPPVAWSAKFNYKSILKQWTRGDEAYNWTNLEARLVWKATYLSNTMLDALITKTSELYEMHPEEAEKYLEEEKAGRDKYDAFIVSVYAGSREHPEVGKDRHLWRMVLESPDHRPVEPAIWLPLPKTHLTHVLYPFQDRWSKTFLVKFPKITEAETREIQLKMVGIPADSQLTWDLAKLQK
jgi:hypothetical protein